MSDQTIINQEKYLDGNGVSYLYLLIKNKLTEFFKTIFVEYKPGWGLSQNDFTNDLKSKLESLSGSVEAEDEIYIISATMTSDNNIEVTQDTADFIRNYTGDKPLYLKIEPVGVYLLYDISYGMFGIARGNQIVSVHIDTETLECTILIKDIAELNEDGKIDIGLLPDNLGGLAEDEIIIVTATFNEETEEVTVDENSAIAIKNYTGDKPMYLKLLPFNWYFAYENESVFSGNANGLFFRFEIDTDALTASFSGSEFMTQDMMVYNFDGSLEELQNTVPTRGAVISYISNNCVTLDNDGKVPSSILPSYVDEVIEGKYVKEEGKEGEFWTVSADGGSEKIIGESGKIYIDIVSEPSKTYRWGGSRFVELLSSSGVSALTNLEIKDIIDSVEAALGEG